MQKYLCLFRGGDERMATMSPEEVQAHMDEWRVWMEGLAEKGLLIDSLPLKAEGKQVSGGGKVVTDGPFAEGAEIVGGYLMMNATSLDEAVAQTKGCPILDAEDGHIEVREIVDM
ncbi:hypothetical protein BXY85_2693 [Roseivirga pacifica]|uniref:Uncharacterized conserved protein n=1 Tax=Roseivirga pacifica TaxID=1267423 RepID=A0A1I0P2M6_9BACT|nr:YciI family protein [Roseivirga pacifica]RKQ51662.1 hypothetical protein BXY85_2693 [Roseivirga pacifica]SEW08500.1 Uncharacterized conserved protein [Roseivirga pacifica]